MKTLYPMGMKTMKDQNDLRDWVTKLVEVDDTIYHMEHVRTMNSWFTNPHIENNKNLYERLKE